MIRVQGSILGYRFSGIKKRIKSIEAIGGKNRMCVCLGHGMTNRHGYVDYLGKNFMVVESGLVTYVIHNMPR